MTIRRRDTDRHGDIVTALLDGCEATVKQPRTVDGHTWLMPRNPAGDPIPAWQAATLGKVASLVRRPAEGRPAAAMLPVRPVRGAARGPAGVSGDPWSRFGPGAWSRGPADARPRPAGRSRPGRAGPVGGTDPRARRGPVPGGPAPLPLVRDGRPSTRTIRSQSGSFQEPLVARRSRARDERCAER
ncbi:S24 family peptidase [Kitasatospora indigofera]|uniref:LexA family protein n=1 Tax=Kitasatospora indigofera TaxID=67307 RepID=UPI00363E6964